MTSSLLIGTRRRLNLTPAMAHNIEEVLSKGFTSTARLDAWARKTDLLTGPSGCGKTTMCQQMHGILDLDHIGTKQYCLVADESLEYPDAVELSYDYIQNVRMFPGIRETMVAGNCANVWRDQLVYNETTHTFALRPALIRLPWRTITVLNGSPDTLARRLASPERENSYGRTPEQLLNVQTYAMDIDECLSKADTSRGVPIGSSITKILIDGLRRERIAHLIGIATASPAPSGASCEIGAPLGVSASLMLAALKATQEGGQ